MTKNTELNRDLIMASLSKFYADPRNVSVISAVVDGSHAVSLRLIDWFVTNYCKKNNIELVKTRSVSAKYNIYVDYRSQLKAFSKHNFDPFRRRDRIKYYFTNDNFITTTVGQLNFFKWAIENGIVDYIECHHEDIERDMTVCYRSNYRAPSAATSNGDSSASSADKRGGRKKRSELSKSCLRKVNISAASRFLSFD